MQVLSCIYCFDRPFPVKMTAVRMFRKDGSIPEGAGVTGGIYSMPNRLVPLKKSDMTVWNFRDVHLAGCLQTFSGSFFPAFTI